MSSLVAMSSQSIGGECLHQFPSKRLTDYLADFVVEVESFLFVERHSLHRFDRGGVGDPVGPARFPSGVATKVADSPDTHGARYWRSDQNEIMRTCHISNDD